MTQVDVIQLAGKVLLCLQDIVSNGQEPTNQRIDFQIECLTHEKTLLHLCIWRDRGDVTIS
jgi:hypothetical protein